MKIENLYEGMIVKNYKELCTLLGLEPSAGNTKKAQLKEFERFCKYSKQGQKIIIEEIYLQPKEKIDNRAEGNKNGKNVVYIDNICDILVDYIYKNKDASNKVLLSFSKLINILGLVNDTYTLGKYRKRELSDILNIKLLSIHYFYDTSRKEFKTIVKTALENLRKRSVIHYTIQKRICEKKVVDGESTKVYRLADEDEISLIVDAQNLALEELGIKDLCSLYLMGTKKYNEYINVVMSELPKDWLFYYDVYEIITGTYAIQKEYNIVEEKRLELNKKSINKMEKSLGVINESNEERKLIDVLIDLLKHDYKLDEQIKDLFDEYKEKKYSTIKENVNEILSIQQKEETLRLNINKTIKDYDERDMVDEYDYYSHAREIKDRKITKEFLEEYNIDSMEIMEDLFG